MPAVRHYTRVRIAVSRLWKGPDLPEIAVLTTVGSSGSLHFERGEEWLLYAEKRDAGYVVSGCGRSTRRVDEEAQQLGPPLVERVLATVAVRPLERAVVAGNARAVRAAINRGDSVQGLFVGGPPVDQAVAACEPAVVAALMAHGGWIGQHTIERALDCPNPSAMVAALGPTEIQWTTELTRAAARGEDSRVSAMLEGGVDPNRAPENGLTPLAQAFAQGRSRTADLLQRSGATLDRRALVGAIRSPDPLLRNLVFETDLDAEDASWLLPFAATDPEVLKRLLALGADPEGPGTPHQPMTVLAVTCAECLERLLAAGAVVDPSVLRRAAESRDLRVVERLLAHGIPVSAADPRSGTTALEAAVRAKDNAEVVEALLAAGADPNAISSVGTPLHAAYDVTVVERLLAAGADPSLRGTWLQWTALEKAAEYGDLAVVKVLLDAGSPWVSILPGEGPLECSARRNNLEVVELLLFRGVPTGSALAQASGEDVVRRLLEAHADPNVPGFRGSRALHVAAARGDLESVALLLAAGADPNALDGPGHTPLVAALTIPLRDGGSEDRVSRIVELLLAAGASMTARTADGRTAADQATATGRTDLAMRLSP